MGKLKDSETVLAFDDFHLEVKTALQRDDERVSWLTSRIYTRRHTGISYRVLNHWAYSGIIPDVRTATAREHGAAEWRRFTIVEAIWINIVRKLREFGLSMPLLKTASDQIWESKGSKLAAAIIACGKRVVVFLLIDSEGNILITDQEGLVAADVETGFGTLLRININDVLCDALDARENYDPKFRMTDVLSPREYEILHMLRKSTTQRITIEKRSGKAKSYVIESDSEFDNIDSVLSPEYGEISLKIHDGRIASKKIKTKRLFSDV